MARSVSKLVDRMVEVRTEILTGEDGKRYEKYYIVFNLVVKGARFPLIDSQQQSLHVCEETTRYIKKVLETNILMFMRGYPNESVDQCDKGQGGSGPEGLRGSQVIEGEHREAWALTSPSSDEG